MTNVYVSLTISVLGFVSLLTGLGVLSPATAIVGNVYFQFFLVFGGVVEIAVGVRALAKAEEE